MASKYMQKFPIPDQFPDILHDFTREILRYEPKDIIEFGVKYFEALLNNEDPCQIQDLEKASYSKARPQQKQENKEIIPKQKPVKETPKEIQQQEIMQDYQSQPVVQEQPKVYEKPITPKIQQQEQEQQEQDRPESSKSKHSNAISHKTEKQISDMYLSKVYNDAALNASEQKSKSKGNDDSMPNFPSGTLWTIIHSFKISEKFNDNEKVYILGFPTTNQQQIYKTQEVSDVEVFNFDAECHFYFDATQQDIEMDEPQIVFQVYKIDSVKEQLGQAIIPLSQFTNNLIKKKDYMLLDQQGKETYSFINITLTWKAEGLDQNNSQNVMIQQEEQSQQDQ